MARITPVNELQSLSLHFSKETTQTPSSSKRQVMLLFLDSE